MSEPQHPSSIPPRRARHAAITTLIGAVATLIGAYAVKILNEHPAPAEPPAAASDGDKPIPVPPKEEPTTDDGVVASRIVREHANQALVEHRARIEALEGIACSLKRELRFTRADLAALKAGKRGAKAHAAFLRATTEWELCHAVTNETRKEDLKLGSLRDEAAAALLQ